MRFQRLLVVLGTLAITATATLAGVAGRSAAGSATEASSVPTTIAGAAELDAVDLFTDMFESLGGDPPNRGNLDQRVVPGSPAAAWVDYLYGFATARLDSRPGPFEPFTVTASATPISGSAAVDVCTEGYCDQFSGFVVDDEGRLETFQLNGVAIDDRLAAPSEPKTIGPISVGLLGAFERVTVDELAVVLAITPAGEQLDVSWQDVTYDDQRGAEIPVDLPASAYPRSIGPVGAQAFVVQFPTAALGGEVVLTYTTASTQTPVEVRVPVDALQP